MCEHTQLKGKNKGAQCKYNSLPDEKYCKYHLFAKTHSLTECNHIDKKTKIKCDNKTFSSNGMCQKHKDYLY